MAMELMYIGVFSLLWFIIGLTIGRYMKVKPLLDTLYKGDVDGSGDRKTGRSQAADEQH